MFKCEQAEAIIMKLGLNCTHWTGPMWPPFKTQTLYPLSASHTWILPSVDPENTSLESGEKHPSTGIPLLLRWPAKVCKGSPLKASIRRITLPFVANKMDFPFGLNLRPVHSHWFSRGKLKVTKGPLSKDLRSYNFTWKKKWIKSAFLERIFGHLHTRLGRILFREIGSKRR